MSTRRFSGPPLLPLLSLIMLGMYAIGCSDNDAGDTGDQESHATPVYVTLAGHLEDMPEYADCNQYPTYRQGLIDFAQELSLYADSFNLQSDYEFLMGVRNCETPELMQATGGRNVLDYLAEVYGFEIDPHQEGGWEEDSLENYADIHYLARQLTDAVTDTVGGFVWQDPDQIAALESGEAGRLYPDYTWYPEILTLAVGTEHHLRDFTQDDLTSGIWRPAGAGDGFHTNDPDARLIYVGPGQQHSTWSQGSSCAFEGSAFRTTVEYVRVLLDYLQRGILPGGKIYTATLAIPQKAIFDADKRSLLIQQLEELEPLVASGRVVLATYKEVVDIWHAEFDEEPNIVRFDTIEPADYTCPVEQDEGPRGFILVHCDPQEILQLHDNFDVEHYDYDRNGVMEKKDMWLALMDLVSLADEFGHKLTLQISPPYVEYITGPECDSTLGDGRRYPEDSDASYDDCRSLLFAWAEAGHELSVHHHGVNHDPLKFDGYTNRPVWNTGGKRPCMDDGLGCDCGEQGCYWCAPPGSGLLCSIYHDPAVPVGYDPEWLGTFAGPGGAWEMMERVFGDGSIRSICMNHQDEVSDMPEDPDIVFTTQGGGLENDPDMYPLCVAYDPDMEYHDSPKYAWFYRHDLINTSFKLEAVKDLVDGARASGESPVVGVVFHVNDFVRSEVDEQGMFSGVVRDLFSYLLDPDGDGDSTDRVEIGTLSEVMIEAGKTEAPDPCVETCYTLDEESEEASYSVPVERPAYCE